MTNTNKRETLTLAELIEWANKRDLDPKTVTINPLHDTLFVDFREKGYDGVLGAYPHMIREDLAQ